MNGLEEITPREFKHQVSKFGIVLSDEDADNLFHKYDTNGNGRIDLTEFVRGLMPKVFYSVIRFIHSI